MPRRVLLTIVSFALLLASNAGASGVAKRPVEVLWGGSYWAAQVVGAKGGLLRVHYVGWGPEWDEWVEPERVRQAPLRRAVAEPRTGQRLEVEWHGSWWPAEVIARKHGFTKIHYTGWGSEWDERVEAARLR
jgi:hypothetical protein